MSESVLVKFIHEGVPDILCWYFPLQFSFFVQVGVFESEEI